MTERQTWLRVLALTPFAQLARNMSGLGSLPPFEHLRAPQIGLAMVRGRMGGDGAAFNLGEMTVSRCTVRVTVGAGDVRDGFACVAGRAPQHAELAAVCDALLQSPVWRDTIIAQVIVPAERLLARARERSAQRRAATKAEFVTVVRSGES